MTVEESSVERIKEDLTEFERSMLLQVNYLDEDEE